MNNNKFTGTGVAMVTPFNLDGSLDLDGLTRLINSCIDGGVEYLVSLGTTGESATLNKEEKDRVVEHTIETINGRVPLVVGLGSNNTADLISSLKSQSFDKIDAILSVSPYYNKPTQEGIYQHYKAVAEACPVDIILYNVPGRTSSNISADTTLRLANDFDNIVAIKEASGDMEQCMDIIRKKPNGFQVISGDDLLALPYLACGMNGVISVIANAYPRHFSDMVRHGLEHNFKSGTDLHYRLMDLMQLLFADGNPGGVKVVLEKNGICKNTLRLPLVPVNDIIKQKLIAADERL